MPHAAGVSATLAGVVRDLQARPRRWLVTGSAGFIGSHLVENLLGFGQHVTSLENFSTGYRHNLEEVRAAVGPDAWQRHRLLEADIVDLAACRTACEGVDIVLHHAAFGSVPRSIADPILIHATNATGFLNMLVAARDAGVSRFVYAASSSIYGDHPALPKVEDAVGQPLSPYAVTKYIDELYAGVFGRCYGMSTLGLRYFNVFGARQDPLGAYAAVIPRWADALMQGAPVVINGDGETTRDFCYIANVVQANLLAATCDRAEAINQVYNIAVGDRMSLNELHATLRDLLLKHDPGRDVPPPKRLDFRPGDVRHSQADISKARKILGYAPTYDARTGLALTLDWYFRRQRAGQYDPAPVARTG